MNTVTPQPTGTPLKAAEQHLNRACEACRGLKVRCLPDNDSSSGKCARCAKSGRPCHYATPQKRRQRKRTDTRVAELEREVRAMRSLLGKGSQPGKHQGAPDSEDGNEEDHGADASSDDDQSGQTFETMPEGWTYAATVNHFAKTNLSSDESPQKRASRSPSSLLPDVIERGILSLRKATELFDAFVNHLVPHAPVVAFPKNVKLSEIRFDKPVLFLSVITAAAGTMNHALFSNLHDEMLRVYADRVIIGCEKSLELVQAMLLTAVWHYPPDDFRELKFYQYIHMASAMALDIGLGNTLLSKPIHRPPPALGSELIREPGDLDSKTPLQTTLAHIMPAEQVSNTSRIPPVDNVIERQRTILACYLMCSSVAMALRRPSMLRFSSWMSDCIESLEHSPLALPSDALLVAWVKLQHIADDCGASFAFDDPSMNLSLSDQRTLLTLKNFETRLEEWKSQLQPGVMNAPLAINFHQNKIFLAEFGIIGMDASFGTAGLSLISLIATGLHEESNPPQLPEFSQKKSKTNFASQAYVSAVMTAVDSAHGVLDTFLSMEPEVIRFGPTIIYVRMCYSVVMCIKIAISSIKPSSGLWKILDVDSLKVDFYIKALIAHLTVVSDSQKFRLASKFLDVLHKLAQWHDKVQQSRISRLDRGQSEIVKSLMSLDVDGGTGIDGTEPSLPAPQLTPSSTVGSTTQTSPQRNQAAGITSNYNREAQPQPFVYMDGSSVSSAGAGGYIPAMDMNSLPPSTTGANPYDMQLSFMPMDMDVDLFGLYTGLGTSAADINYWNPADSFGFGSQQDWTGNFK